jgi:hypothetical protein
LQASLITEQPKLAMADCTPLIEQVVVVVNAFVVLGAFVEVVVFVEVFVEVGVFLVVDADEVVVFLGVVVAASGCRFFFKLSQAAVTVIYATPLGPGFVSVEVISLIGTKELLKAEALRATSTDSQAATLSRASISERPILAAEVNGASNAKVATIEAGEMYIVIVNLFDKTRAAD